MAVTQHNTTTVTTGPKYMIGHPSRISQISHKSTQCPSNGTTLWQVRGAGSMNQQGVVACQKHHVKTSYHAYAAKCRVEAVEGSRTGGGAKMAAFLRCDIRHQAALAGLDLHML
jgi:hypothetical protein